MLFHSVAALVVKYTAPNESNSPVVLRAVVTEGTGKMTLGAAR